MTVDIEAVTGILREVAAEEVMPRFRRLAEHEIRAKSGGELVTVADVAAERQIKRRLRDLLPGSQVVGEEATAEDPGLLDKFTQEDDWIWVIDPIDGTANFAAGRPVFALMVALVRRGETEAAWIFDPLGPRGATAERGAGAWLDGTRLTLGPPPPLAELRGTLHASKFATADMARRIQARRARVGAHSSEDLRPGELEDHERRLRSLLDLSGCEATAGAGAGAGEPTFVDLPEVEGDTVHLDVIDRHGNMVSATPSGGWLSGSPVVPGLGFGLTTRGQMFWLTDELPSGLAPGKRPRTTLTPTMASKDGTPCLAFGTPGGDQQDQWTVPVFLRHLHHGMNLQAAIDAPLFHSKHAVSSFYPRERHPGVLLMEGRFPEATRRALAARGHKITVEGDWALGRVCAVGSRDGLLRAAATPRFMQGYAIGR